MVGYLGAGAANRSPNGTTNPPAARSFRPGHAGSAFRGDLQQPAPQFAAGPVVPVLRPRHIPIRGEAGFRNH